MYRGRDFEWPRASAMEGNQVEVGLERRCVRDGEEDKGVWDTSHTAVEIVRSPDGRKPSRKRREVGVGTYEDGLECSVTSGVFSIGFFTALLPLSLSISIEFFSVFSTWTLPGEFCSRGLSLEAVLSTSCASPSSSSTPATGSGTSSLIHDGGKDADSRLSHASSHLNASESIPSESSGTDTLSTLLPSSGDNIRLVPAGVHRPETFKKCKPLTSGTAPLSSKKPSNSPKSISAWGTCRSSLYCNRYSLVPVTRVFQLKQVQVPPRSVDGLGFWVQ